MMLSELIEQLGQLYVQHGDMRVVNSAPHSAAIGRVTVENGCVYLKKELPMDLSEEALEQALIDIENWAEKRGLQIK